MIRKSIFTIALFLTVTSLYCQEKLPVIKATSKKVDIRMEISFRKGYWNITPEANPTLYFILKRKAVPFIPTGILFGKKYAGHKI